MRAIPRIFAAAAAVLTLSTVVSACDVSPYAARVNSQVIKETTLHAELAEWAGNREYVSAFDADAQKSSACQQDQFSCVFVSGDAPGTYNNEWVSSILTGMITANVVHQRLQATGRRVNQAGLQAARAVSEITQFGWTTFSTSFRDTLVRRLADQALITPQFAQLSQEITQAYQQYKAYFFSKVCVVQAAAFSLGEASVISANGDLKGQPVCYNQANLENQAPDLRQTIMGLDVGKVSRPVKTPYGYIVVKVTSREVIALTPELQRTISVFIVNAQGANDTVNALLARASVKVNPAFGSWSRTSSGFGVTPPKLPLSST